MRCLQGKILLGTFLIVLITICVALFSIELPRTGAANQEKPDILTWLIQSWNPGYGIAPTVNKHIKLGVFVDGEAMKHFQFHLNRVKEEYRNDRMIDIVLPLISGVQALFHHRSLGELVDLSVVFMNFGEYNFSSQADDASFILRDFCSFQHQFNNQSNSHPEHWTIGVLLTGKDLYFNKDGQIKDTSVMTYKGGIASLHGNCLVCEFGARRQNGVLLQTSGYGAVYPLAYGIARNLGISDDGIGNNCMAKGHIMSPDDFDRINGIPWSRCTAQKLAAIKRPELYNVTSASVKYPIAKYENKPGKEVNALEQCHLFIGGRTALLETTPDTRCRSLSCRSKGPTISGGPALPGTVCDEGRVNCASRADAILK